MFQWKPQKRGTNAQRKAELEDLSATDQGRFELVEILNKYRGQSGDEALPWGTLAVSEILEYEFGPADNVARVLRARKECDASDRSGSIVNSQTW